MLAYVEVDVLQFKAMFLLFVNTPSAGDIIEGVVGNAVDTTTLIVVDQLLLLPATSLERTLKYHTPSLAISILALVAFVTDETLVAKLLSSEYSKV